MRKVNFKLEVITPLFLAGEDQNSPEIRPPSIKNIMRFWYRAGAYTNDIKELKKKEGEIFGDTTKGSKISIKVIPHNLNIGRNIDEKFGLKYLLFSMAMQMRRGERSYISPGSTFTLQISSKDEDEDKLKQALASLWLLIYLGGLGSRARRGGGNLAVVNTDINFPELPGFLLKASNINELANFLQDGVRRSRNLLGAINTNTLPEYTALNRNTTSINIINSIFDSWEKGLDFIGSKFQQFRRKYPLGKRIPFGLPIGGRMDVRRSSPLFIKVNRLSNRKFAVLVNKFGSIFRPSEQISLDIIDDFISELQVVEVTR